MRRQTQSDTPVAESRVYSSPEDLFQSKGLDANKAVILNDILANSKEGSISGNLVPMLQALIAERETLINAIWTTYFVMPRFIYLADGVEYENEPLPESCVKISTIIMLESDREGSQLNALKLSIKEQMDNSFSYIRSALFGD